MAFSLSIFKLEETLEQFVSNEWSGWDGCRALKEQIRAHTSNDRTFVVQVLGTVR